MYSKHHLRPVQPLRSFLTFLVCTIVCLVLFARAGLLSQESNPSSDRKPNIIFIFADDVSYQDTSAYGQEKFTTPNLDQLAENGLRFTQSYTGAPECAPARGSLMTGMHMGHCRIRRNGSVRGQEHLLDEDITVAEVLKKAGYTTGFIGKWGIGLPGTQGAPHKQGFDHAFGFYDQSRAHTFYPHYLMRNGETVSLPENYGFNMDRVYTYNRRHPNNLDGVKNPYNDQGKLVPDGVPDPEEATHSENLFQKEALQFMKKNRDNPFFLYYATQIPHGPTITPDISEFQDNDWSLKHKEWASMMKHLDRGVGRMINTLEQMDLLENTIIFYAGDNGYSMDGYFGYSRHKEDPIFENKGPWPKGKFKSTHEGGVRVPLFVYWKGHIKPGRTDHITALYDFLPTAADLAGIEPPETDGISFVPTLAGNYKKQEKHKYLYWENGSLSRKSQSVRMGRWWAYRPNPSASIRLYDITNDVKCKNNLAQKHPEVVEQVKQIFREAHEDSKWYPDPTDTREDIRKKKQRAERTLRSVDPNTTKSHPMLD